MKKTKTVEGTTHSFFVSGAFFTNIKSARGIAIAPLLDTYRDTYRGDRANEMALPNQLSSLEYPQHGTKHPGATEMQMMRCSCSLKIGRDDGRRNGRRVSTYLRVNMRVREIIARTILRNAVDTRLRNLGIRKAKRGSAELRVPDLVNQGRALLAIISQC